MKITPIHILIYALIVTGALFITENFYHPVYLIQMTQKVLSFLLVPLFITYLLGQTIGRFGRIEKSSIIYGVSFGLLSVLIIGVTYLLLRDTIDWKGIQTSIEARGVNETTFLLAFGYIMFGNSLIEEYFFRGVIFRSLFERLPVFAYIISSLLFSLYHLAIFGTWFSGYILFLALFGLFLGGLFFAWLYRKTGGVWGAWIFHIFADFAILVIGYIELFS